MGNENGQPSKSKIENKVNESDTKHAVHISETASDKLYNAIVRIDKESKVGTGFFMKAFIKNKLKHFLFTCHHVVSKKDIESKISLEVYYGKKNNEQKKVIKLDTERRFITFFEGDKDVTIIEILESDDIPEDKYLLADLSYKYGYDVYKNGKFLLAGYPKDNIYKNERHISSGEIKSIKGYVFEHSLDTRYGSSGSPICLFENTQVIGIHKQGNRVKPINYGTFIGAIIDELENKYKENKKENFKSEFFFSLEDFNDKKNICFYKNVIKYSKEQNSNNFKNAYYEIKTYVYNIDINFNKEEFLKNLELYENVENDYIKIINNYTRDDGIWKYMIFILRGKDDLLREKFSYFTGGFLKSLKMSNTVFKRSNYYYYGTKMNNEEIVNLTRNINKIICAKSFLSSSLLAKVASLFGFRGNRDNKFGVLFKIKYNYRDELEDDLFSIGNYSIYKEEHEVLFNIFSFYRIIDVEVNESERKVYVELNSVGREKNFESKLYNMKNGNTIHFNTQRNLLEIK